MTHIKKGSSSNKTIFRTGFLTFFFRQTYSWTISSLQVLRQMSATTRFVSCPTDTIVILEPKSSRIDTSEVDKFRRSTDFEALEL